MKSTRSRFLFIAALLGGAAVLAGAFGAHYLKEVLEPAKLISYKTAVRYQMWHALLLVALGMGPVFDEKAGKRIGWFFVGGTLLFSGSIYLLSFFSWAFLGPITPLGGLLLLAGWVLLAVWVVRNKTFSHEK